MKKYIIIGWCGGMGGGHIYTRNQCVIAKKLGWTPVVIHFSAKETVISDLKQFDRNRIRELRFPPSYYSKKEQNIILNKLLSIVNPQQNDQFFVESNDTCVSYWGEILAKRLKCKHFSFLLEFYFRNKEDNLDYLVFKLKRKELAGIMQHSLPSLFKSRYLLPEDENKWINAFCTNSVENIPIPFDLDTSRYDYIIGNIGRSTKPYVQWIGEDVSIFANKHPDKRFLLLLVGGEKDSPAERKILDSLERCNNVDVYSTGFLFPIPMDLLKKIDVVTATSGCIRAAQEANILTIAYKDNERNPYGVCGCDLKEVTLPDYPIKALSLCEYLEGILFGDFCTQYPYTKYLDYVSDEKRWQQLEEDTKYMLLPSETNYYDTTRVFPKQIVLRFFIKTIGHIYPLHRFMEIVEKTGIMIKINKCMQSLRNTQVLPG